jgi:hypothetical protein
MRVSDAGLRRHEAKLIYLNHRLPPWPAEDVTTRSLEPMLGGGIINELRRLPYSGDPGLLVCTHD